MSESVTIAQANFALNLIQEIGLNKSAVISPISISFALGMILLGANGNTAREIENAIAKGIIGDELHNHLLNVYNFINDNKNTVKMGNKVYFADNLQIFEYYKKQLQKFYNGNFQLTDFTDTQKAANEINEFVADSTNNEILNIIDKVSESCQMILVNAIYFEEKWANPFTPCSYYTLFYSMPNVTKGLLMMENKGCYNYAAKENNYQFLEIPYITNYFSMFIILPYERFGLSKMLKSFNVNELLDMMFATNSIEGNVVIPKFTAESSFELSQILRHLKINDAFDASNADFSGVTTDAKIHISRILQKVSVKVSEEGTKAAVATVLEDIFISNDDDTFQFTADHPFLYILADKNKNIYFVGTFYN